METSAPILMGPPFPGHQAAGPSVDYSEDSPLKVTSVITHLPFAEPIPQALFFNSDTWRMCRCFSSYTAEKTEAGPQMLSSLARVHSFKCKT